MKTKSTYFLLAGQSTAHITLITLTISVLTLFFSSCKSSKKLEVPGKTVTSTDSILHTGAEDTGSYFPLIRHKKVALVANQTSLLRNAKGNYTHLVDTLLAQNIAVQKVFSPEHGFRGKADAGEKVSDNIDAKTGLPLISLYGSHKRPTSKQLKGIDVILFDLQDVGVRFYTYLSTLHYVMEAAAENHIPLIVLDRPNPNAAYIDGPVLQEKYHSFIGMHPVPVVYGMSIGEYARMINGEKWLRNGQTCDLQVVKLRNYTHHTQYTLPVKPSPNLPNAQAVALYPSLCFFEGTCVSCGRGTSMQFQIFGDPELPPSSYPFHFTPQPNEGAKHPKHQGKICYGKDLRKARVQAINLQWLRNAYASYPDKTRFFKPFFTKLAGTAALQNQIELGYSDEDIHKTWEPGLQKFKKIRAKYLLYPE